jgi:hypothetical protein
MSPAAIPSLASTTNCWMRNLTVGSAADLADGTSADVGGTLTGSSTTSVPLALTGLTPNTAYRFRLSATNPLGTSNSAISTLTTLPPTPTAAMATRGDGELEVAWSIPTPVGGVAVTWTATASPGSHTCTSTGATCTITGLTNGTAYTVVVRGHNGGGSGSASTPSAAVTPAAAPGAPAIVGTPLVGDGTATVAWTTPGSDGGAAITGYTVTADPGGQTCTWTSGPLQCVVTGLTNSITYTFTVTATNAVGTGPASAPSGAVTPRLAIVPSETTEEQARESTNV